MPRIKKIFSLSVIYLIFMGSHVSAQIGCDRACLEDHITTYLDALIASNPSGVPLAVNAKISVNNRLVPLADTFWADAEETIYRWDIANTRLGDVATESVIRNGDGSVTMIMVRLKVANNVWTEV